MSEEKNNFRINVIFYVGFSCDPLLEFSFEQATVNGVYLTNGGTLAITSQLYNSPTISSSDVKVGSGSLQLSASSSQYVSIPAFTTGSSGLSFACWFKSSGSSWARIFEFGNGPDADNIIMFINLINGLALTVYNAGVVQSENLNVVSINNNVWYHVVWTLDPSGAWMLYLNGALTWQVTNYFYPRAISRTNNNLGKANWNGDPFFNGALDEFRMYNRVLTSSDVQLFYSGVCTSTSSPTLTPSGVPTTAPMEAPTLPPTLTPSVVPTIAPTLGE